MSGHTRGVQARMKEFFPLATYVHCKSHSLSLAICDTCTIPVVRNMYATASKVLTFIKSSPKRLQVYIAHSEKARLKRFCPTRWTYHSESIHVLLENFGAILETLDALKLDNDTNTKNDATSLCAALTSFEFLVTMVLVEAPMQHLASLCSTLQSEQCDLVKASSSAMSVIGVLSGKRNSEEYFEALWNKACGVAKREEIPVTKPRLSGRQKHRLNAAASADDTPQHYWKINLHLPFLDHLIVQLEDRLTIPRPRLKAQYLVPCNISMLDDSMWTSIKVKLNYPATLTDFKEKQLLSCISS